MYPTDRPSLERSCTIEYVRASGPGGQHRNRRETGIRLTHSEANVTVMATERRSRLRNLELAFERMAERLEQLNYMPKPRRKRHIPWGVRKKRVANKRHRGKVKTLRRRPPEQ